MKATIRIDMDNAAFEDAGNELAWILRKMADKIDAEVSQGKDIAGFERTAFDSNGNTVGGIKVTK